MAPGFARSISLPLSPNHKKASYHVRSVSLPSQSHPLISNLEKQIRAVKSWVANPDESPAWIAAGLAHIELLQMALEDFLQLSATQEILHQAASVDQLLEDLLQLVDAYGSFVSTILTLKECHSNVQSAFHRHDEVGTTSSLRSQRNVEKEIVQLSSSLKAVTKCRHEADSSDPKEIEVAGTIMEAISSTAAASMAVFTAVGSLSSTVFSKNSSGTIRSLIKLVISSSLMKSSTRKQENIDTFERFEELNECIRNTECCNEHLFRSLINSRVSPLNTITPCL